MRIVIDPEPIVQSYKYINQRENISLKTLIIGRDILKFCLLNWKNFIGKFLGNKLVEIELISTLNYLLTIIICLHSNYLQSILWSV